MNELGYVFIVGTVILAALGMAVWLHDRKSDSNHHHA